MASPRRILSKKTCFQDGICIIIENGAPCNRPVDSRGLCAMHKSYLRMKGTHEKYALPVQSRKKDYRVNPAPLAGKCCVIEDGVVCDEMANRHGGSLCKSHYAAIWQRQKLSRDIDINDFKTSLIFARKSHPRVNRCVVKEIIGRERVVLCEESAEIRGICKKHAAILEANPALFEAIANPLVRRKHVQKGICVILENAPGGKEIFCTQAHYSRGLCRYHYKLLRRRSPEVFDKIADPVKTKPVFRLKKEEKQRDGVCVLVENGTGCNEPTSRKRRVCDLHYYALKRAGLLEELTAPFIEEIKERSYHMEQKPQDSRVEGFCIMMVNGIPCTNTPKRRGLCDACIWKIEKFGYNFEKLALPAAEKYTHELSRKAALVKGVCVVIENGIPCREFSLTRGLCNIHYKLAKRQHRLNELALSEEEMSRLADIPHFYFDKNLIIRFALHEIFGQAADSSVALVDAVLHGRLHSTISTDCMRALYSHLGHLLARPVEEGGKGIEPRKAESMAREYTGKLFFGRGGIWNIVSFHARHFELCAYQGCLIKLSLEDALELQIFSLAKEQNRVKLFVTADRGILEYGEGVHPDDVVKMYADYLDPQYLRKKRR
ncbi:MAG: hypothetical protein AB2L14_22495 [Candidatus Xenobiia bacterium LiM19]